MSAHMTEDQTLLQDAAERYLRDSYDFNQRRERIAAGVYSDPNHPGCRRQIRTMAHGRLALVTGEDGDPGCPPKDPSKDSHWRLLGKIISDTEILVDLSPKGGPKYLEGKWCRGCGDHGGISWPDGNEWHKELVEVEYFTNPVPLA